MKRLLASAAVVAVAALGVPMAAATSASAAGPQLTTTITLTCPSSDASTMAGIYVFDRHGNALFNSWSLGCPPGGSPVSTDQTVGAKAVSYCWYQWSWTTPISSGSATWPSGSQCTSAADATPLAKGNQPTILDASTVGGPSGLTLTIS